MDDRGCLAQPLTWISQWRHRRWNLRLENSIDVTAQSARHLTTPTPNPSPQEPAPGRAQARPGWGGEFIGGVIPMAPDTDRPTSSCPALCRASTSFFILRKQDVDGRDKPGHDDVDESQPNAVGVT